MSNAKAHRLGAGIVVGATTALLLDFEDKNTQRNA